MNNRPTDYIQAQTGAEKRSVGYSVGKLSRSVGYDLSKGQGWKYTDMMGPYETRTANSYSM